MSIEITSAGKKAQKLSDVAAAVFVLTQEDLQRSGVTSIPEALRMVPGVQVARIDANKWAITARGFNDRFANKLLVLMDGRTVYTPTFSGVFWDVQDTLLEDIERIEVIRGPGAALWGANAVNGVINIISKRAQDTQGGLVTAGGGTEERGFGGVRYGMQLVEDVYARVYIKYFNRDGGVDAFGDATADDWDVIRGGCRLDWQASTRDLLAVQGDIYDGTFGTTIPLALLVPPFSQTVNDDGDIFGGNVLMRWQRTFSAASDLSLQLYYDRTERSSIQVEEDTIDTVDLDFQHRFAWGTWQEIVWGLGYRFIHDMFTNSSSVSFTPDSRSRTLLSAFVQDDMTLIKNRLRLTLGLRLEHNDYTGFEVQPNARLLWTPHVRHAVWGAVSRAVRTPSRTDFDVRVDFATTPAGTPDNPGPLPTLLAIFGNRDLDSEELLAYELGYRTQPLESLFLDLALFYHDYDHLVGSVLGTPSVATSPMPVHLVVPVVFSNNLEGEVYGVEVAAEWQPLDWWRLYLAYTYQQIHLRIKGEPAPMDTQDEDIEGRSPRHQVSFRSSLDLTGNLAFDVWVRYVDALSTLMVSDYVTLDARLAWRPWPKLELALVGQNLVNSDHREFVSVDGISTKVQRGVYGKITWNF
jgi:iron complex outermembrane receptor protein